MARRKRPRPHLSHERWLVSYADFITLLFAFFTTMYAISTVDAMKLSDMVESMQTAFATGEVPTERPGPGSGTPQRINVPAQPAEPKKQVMVSRAAPRATPSGLQPVSVEEVEARLSQRLQRQMQSGQVAIEMDPRGLVVSIREAGSFPTGKADLSTLVQTVLAEVAAALREVGNSVRVEGHTDNVPIHTDRYGSNWELSTARATNVVAYLMARGLQPQRLSAAGYGEFHPRVANDTDAGRARNRRIDIVVLNPQTGAREEPGQLAAATP